MIPLVKVIKYKQAWRLKVVSQSYTSDLKSIL